MQGLSADTYFCSIPVALLSFSNMLEKMRRESMIAGIVDYRVCNLKGRPWLTFRGCAMTGKHMTPFTLPYVKLSFSNTWSEQP